MIIKKYLFLIVLLSGLLFLRTGQALADVAPDRPSCTEVNEKTGQPGCGYLDSSLALDVTSYEDKFVFLVEYPGYEDSSVIYTVIDGKFNQGDKFNDEIYIAVNKDYFNQNGGLKGIFRTTKIPSYPGSSDTVDTMSPKDQAVFKKNSYQVIVSKSDANVYIDQQNIIEGQYSLFHIGRGDYVVTPNLSCVPNKCSKVITYAPQAVIGNYIVVAQSKAEFAPANANSPAPYVAFQDNNANSIISDSSSSQQNLVTPPQQVSAAEFTTIENLSWWQRLWNAIKSFFKSIFK